VISCFFFGFGITFLFFMFVLKTSAILILDAPMSSASVITSMARNCHPLNLIY